MLRGFFAALGAQGVVSSSLLGALVGASGYTLYTSEGTAYLSDDPEACIKCHIMREHYDGWQKASHHAFATCNTCHLPHETVPKYIQKAENGFWHSKGFTFQDFPEPIRIRPKNRDILNSNCIGCHSEMVGEIAYSHSADKKPLDCIGCHAEVGHGPRR